MSRNKITIPFKEYNAMKASRVILWIAFIFVIFAAIIVVSMLCLIGRWVSSAGTGLTIISPIAFLCVSLLLLRKYRLMAILLTFRVARRQNIPFAKWIAVAYALFRITSSIVMIVLVLTNLSVGLPEATPQNISLFIVENLAAMLPELLFAYFGYKAFSDIYYRYFISQPLSRVIRENTILFS